jgi:hypothetical protein
MSRPQPALVVVGEILGFQGRHVDADGAIVGAAFAGEAEIERIEHLLAAPQLELGSVQHLKEDARPAAGGVLLVSRDHVARAHDAALHAAALSNADAAHRRVREAAVVVRIGKLGADGRRVVVGA